MRILSGIWVKMSCPLGRETRARTLDKICLQHATVL